MTKKLSRCEEAVVANRDMSNASSPLTSLTNTPSTAQASIYEEGDIGTMVDEHENGSVAEPQQSTITAAAEPDALVNYKPPKTSSAIPNNKKMIHNSWVRYCHAVPKCDWCENKAGGTGLLHRCTICLKNICQSCVDSDGYVLDDDSDHPIIHVIDKEKLDWDPPTKSEKETIAMRKKVKGVATVSGGQRFGRKGRAVRGRGLKRRSNIGTRGEAGFDDAARGGHGVVDAVVPPMYADERLAENRGQKRGLSPSNIHEDLPIRPKEPRIEGSPRRRNSLAPIRATGEPNPPIILPPLRQINSLGYGSRPGRWVSQNQLTMAPQTEEGRQYTPGWPRREDTSGDASVSAYSTAQRQSYQSSPRPQPHSDSWRPQACILPTAEQASIQYQNQDTNQRASHHHAQTQHPLPNTHEAPVNTHSRSSDINLINSELYNDIIRTHRDYTTWSMSTCVLHEVARSWSRGSLYHVTRSIGLTEGMQVLGHVVGYVCDTFDVRGDPVLQNWMAEQRRRA